MLMSNHLPVLLNRTGSYLEEYDTFDDALKLCQRAVTEYNCDHPHSNLEMLSPNEFTRLVLDGRVRITEKQTVEILPEAA